MHSFTASTVAILVQLASEQITLGIELDDCVGEELEPHEAIFVREECNVHLGTYGNGFVEAMLDRFRNRKPFFR
jgi:hypothetical protein